MRNKRLDILRCIAVGLVLGRHGLVDGVWKETGWAGVDLFFVLSGFLISGLLFNEYHARQRIGLRRFFIRRGFKIYPAFYAMLLVTFFTATGYGLHIPLEAWLREILFVQNYTHGMWRHTWTLAVEEHFYLLLPLALLALTKLSKNRTDPFWFIPYGFCILAPLILILRVGTAYQPSFQFEDAPKVMFPTHMRIDALLFGVVLGYFHHFRPNLIPGLLKSRWNRLAIQAATAVFLSCILGFYAESRFMLSFGLTLVYLGFGGILVLSLYGEPSATPFWSPLMRKVGDALAYVGMYSYSIYLWHVPIVAHAMGAMVRIARLRFSPSLLNVFYVALSVGGGILMARIIEFPALALRDRLFPGVCGATIPSQTANTHPAPAGHAQAIVT